MNILCSSFFSEVATTKFEKKIYKKKKKNVGKNKNENLCDYSMWEEAVFVAYTQKHIFAFIYLYEKTAKIVG